MDQRLIGAWLASLALVGNADIQAASDGAMTGANQASAEDSAATASVRLFTIARSKNANLVSYEVRVGPAGFDTAEPIHARWLMFEADGRQEELTRLEQRVYGVRLESAIPTEVRFALAAIPSRTIVVRQGPQGPQAVLQLNGVPCRLEEIFIASTEGLVPKVRYADLRGRSLADGSQFTERITP